MPDSQKWEPKYTVSISISIFIIVLVIIRLVQINSLDIKQEYLAQKGILDIQNAKIEKYINLKGEWEFYPGIFLDPNNPKELSKYEKDKVYAYVPGSWESYLNEEGSAEGSGTYRLKIKLPKDELYGIRTRTIRLASEVYLNGKGVISLGIPSLIKENFKRESKYKIGAAHSTNSELELIIHISSYGYRVGGIIKPIEFGKFESIITESNKNRALDAITISVCLILGLYFLIIYFQRSKELYLFYFAIANLSMAFYLSLMDEQLLDLIFTYGFTTRIRMQVILMILTMLFLLQFIHQFFINYSSGKLVKWITCFNLSLLLLSFKDPANLSVLSTTFHQSLIIIGYLSSYTCIAYILLKSIYKKADSLEYILVITIMFFLYWFLITLKIFMELDLGKIHVLLITIILMSTAPLMSHRLQLDYQKTKLLSNELLKYDKFKDNFLVTTSHELKMPLYIIHKKTKQLLEGRKGAVNSSQQKNLLFIHQEGQRLMRLVDDLLDAYQIKEGNTILRLSNVNTYEIVEDILKEIEVLIPKNKNIVIKNQIPLNFPYINADTDKFRQIIYNLVNNAIQYTEKGEIVVSGSKVLDKAEIIISDTGIGIDKEYHKDIFDIFYKINNGDNITKGLGLGLYIVKYLIEVQGGKIEIESSPGKGSHFKFLLPICKNKQPNIIGRKHITLPKEQVINYPNRPVVLIIDSDIDYQVSLMDIMEELKLNIIMSDSDSKALQIIEKEKVDLVILDFMLSDMYVNSVCGRIRENYSMSELPILLLTSSNRIMNRINIFEYGINDFQSKPLDFNELKSRINSLLLMKESIDKGLKKEFQYFYSQISPHFLYNTINTIIGVSYRDSEMARRALNNLSIYFRGKLDLHKDKELVPLDEELDLITAYLEIEQMRYGERLKIEYDIDNDIKVMLPPLTLQPIIENAVRHGMSTKDRKITIRVTIKEKEEGFAYIVIEDDGIGMTKEKQEELLSENSERIGFNNVMKKIKIIKGSNFALNSELGKGTKVEIIVPEVSEYESNFS